MKAKMRASRVRAALAIERLRSSSFAVHGGQEELKIRKIKYSSHPIVHLKKMPNGGLCLIVPANFTRFTQHILRTILLVTNIEQRTEIEEVEEVSILNSIDVCALESSGIQFSILNELYENTCLAIKAYHSYWSMEIKQKLLYETPLSPIEIGILFAYYHYYPLEFKKQYAGILKDASLPTSLVLLKKIMKLARYLRGKLHSIPARKTVFQELLSLSHLANDELNALSPSLSSFQVPTREELVVTT